jgi:hypothetical protein
MQIIHTNLVHEHWSTSMKQHLSLLILFSCLRAAFSVERLCSNPDTGVFIGLAVDEKVYVSVPGGPDPDTGKIQSWNLVDEDSIGPSHSFTGRYLQVVPDEGRVYPSRGEHLTDLKQLENNSPYVAFRLDVSKEGAGWHTLFLRWTGGDTVGGGDSVFVSLHSLSKSKSAIAGHRSLKPLKVPIDSTFRNFAGCCYDMQTHACPCQKSQPTNETCPNYIVREEAAKFGAQCSVGPGVMEFVDSPQWYLYAGQEVGNVMDFDAEPWDATCEAEGSDTADSGRDYASWNIPKGEFELRIYAREDGTAVDAIYIAGPNGKAPGLLQKFGVGDSTICTRSGSSGLGSALRTSGFILLIAGVVLGALVAVAKTDQGSAAMHEVLQRISQRRVPNPSVSSDGIMNTYSELRLQETI